MGEMADMIVDMATCYDDFWTDQDEDPEELTCSYCGGIAGEVNGRIVYPHRPDLARLKFFYCANGHDPAYVGTHQDSGKPLGTLANASLRAIRYRAHLAFDRLWKQSKNKRKVRTATYKALAKHLRIAQNNCHIAKLNEEQCQQVIDYSYSIKPEFDPIEEQ